MQPTDPDKFTDKAWEGIVKSQDIVRAYQQQQLDVEHLIIALLQQENGLAARLINRTGVDANSLLQQLEEFIRRQPKVGKSDQLYLGRALDEMLDVAENARVRMQDSYISIEHILLGFLEDERVGRRICKGLNLDTPKLENTIKTVRGNQKVTDQNPESRYEALQKVWQRFNRTGKIRKIRSGNWTR